MMDQSGYPRCKVSKSRLITTSLIGAVDWCNTAPKTHIDHDPTKPTWRDQAFVDLDKTLNRVWDNSPKPYLDRGIKFENAVYKEAGAPTGRGSEHFQWFVSECKGGEFQRKSKKYIDIDGFTYCIYGKLDAWFPDIIKDVKTTSKWKGDTNYLNTWQHRLYCYTENINRFRYIVAVFDDPDEGPLSNTIVERHAVDYVVPDREELEQDIVSKIKEVVSFLSIDPEWFDAYTNKFSMY